MIKESNKTLLIIGHTWPEPQTTAAGGRMLQLVGLFKELSFHITFASTATINPNSVDLKAHNVEVKQIALNDPSFDTWIKSLNPTIIMYDRFVTEEQFGWRVREQCPFAMTILDTEDLHFLRKARQEAVKNGKEVKNATLFSETAKRELASILRCDVSLIISEVEMKLLQQTFTIPKGLLYYLPFLVTAPSEIEVNALPTFEDREHFVTIGNLLHAPNVDSVLYIKNKLWESIRKQLPEARIHVYGNYAPQQIQELHNPKEGFFIMGWAPSAAAILKNARVCLAPIRFGAGLKGKFIDAMQAGTPIVTTPIGAEGMFTGTNVMDDVSSLVATSVTAYTNKDSWLEYQEKGFEVISQKFQKTIFSEAFKKHILSLLKNIDAHRQQHFIGQILQHHTLKSTMYLSKWIAEKNKS